MKRELLVASNKLLVAAFLEPEGRYSKKSYDYLRKVVERVEKQDSVEAKKRALQNLDH